MFVMSPRKQHARWAKLVEPNVRMDPRLFILDSPFRELAIDWMGTFRSVEVASEDGEEIKKTTTPVVVHEAENVGCGAIRVYGVELLDRGMDIVGQTVENGIASRATDRFTGCGLREEPIQPLIPSDRLHFAVRGQAVLCHDSEVWRLSSTTLFLRKSLSGEAVVHKVRSDLVFVWVGHGRSS